MKRIAIISNSAQAILGFRLHLIKFLLKRGYEVLCFAPNYTSDTENKVFLLGAIPIKFNLSRGGLNPIRDYKDIRKLTFQLKELKPDIVLSTFVKPVVFGTLAAKRANIKFIVGMLEGLGYFFTEQPKSISIRDKIIKRVQIILYKIALPKTDLLIFLNQNDPVDLLKRYNIMVKKTSIIDGIGLSLSDYPYTKPHTTPVSFLFIGRLLKEKGIYEYLEAAKKLKEKYPQIVFYIIGAIDKDNPGSLKENELDFYIRTGIINYQGHVTNVQHWITKSSVFVLPSYREGLPRSTQEAMAMGRPIITTDVPGCRETVIDGYNGFLVKRWDVDDLVEKMAYFVSQPQTIEKMGMKSYSMALERFDMNKINEKLLSMIDI